MIKVEFNNASAYTTIIGTHKFVKTRLKQCGTNDHLTALSALTQLTPPSINYIKSKNFNIIVM